MIKCGGCYGGALECEDSEEYNATICSNCKDDNKIDNKYQCGICLLK
jgi:hypothetical protein